MGTITNALKDGKIVGGIIALGLMTGIGVAVAPAIVNANAEPAAVVVTDEPALTFDLDGTTANGLADEQEAEAAAAEQARIAAEAEAARVAAEQAAAAEAARIAAEQAAAPEGSADEPSDGGGSEPVDPWAGKTPVPFIVDPNPENAAGGFYDVSQCPSGSASTGPDGVPYCD